MDGSTFFSALENCLRAIPPMIGLARGPVAWLSVLYDLSATETGVGILPCNFLIGRVNRLIQISAVTRHTKSAAFVATQATTAGGIAYSGAAAGTSLLQHSRGGMPNRMWGFAALPMAQT